jgi:flagellar basal body-associated protein FliL
MKDWVCRRGWKGVNRMEKKKESKKESPLPMLVLLITIAIGAIVLVRFILFSE